MPEPKETPAIPTPEEASALSQAAAVTHDPSAHTLPSGLTPEQVKEWNKDPAAWEAEERKRNPSSKTADDWEKEVKKRTHGIAAKPLVFLVYTGDERAVQASGYEFPKGKPVEVPGFIAANLLSNPAYAIGKKE